MQHKFKHTDIEAAAIAHGFIDEIDSDVYTVAGDWSRDMMGCMAPTIEKLAKSCGFWADDDFVYYDSEGFDVLNHIFGLVDTAYDAMNETPEGSETTWKLLGLSGDDDVDYNCGYPTTVLDCVVAILKAAENA